jgi:hypothetical protein
MGDKPTIKLMKLFALKEKYDYKFDADFICQGIWKTQSVFYKDGHRAYELVCVAPFYETVKRGDTRKMYEDTIIATCDRIEIVRTPIEKLNSTPNPQECDATNDQ